MDIHNRAQKLDLINLEKFVNLSNLVINRIVNNNRLDNFDIFLKDENSVATWLSTLERVIFSYIYDIKQCKLKVWKIVHYREAAFFS